MSVILLFAFFIIKFTNKHSSWLHQLIKGRPTTADGSAVVFLCKYAGSPASLRSPHGIVAFLASGFSVSAHGKGGWSKSCLPSPQLFSGANRRHRAAFSRTPPPTIAGYEIMRLWDSLPQANPVRNFTLALDVTGSFLFFCFFSISLIFHINEVVAHWGYHEGIIFFIFFFKPVHFAAVWQRTFCSLFHTLSAVFGDFQLFPFPNPLHKIIEFGSWNFLHQSCSGKLDLSGLSFYYRLRLFASVGINAVSWNELGEVLILMQEQNQLGHPFCLLMSPASAWWLVEFHPSPSVCCSVAT